MGKNIRWINLALSLLALPQFILPSTAFANIKFCNQMVAFKPKISLSDYQMHGPRLLAMQMSDDRMMRDLLALTGRVPVDCHGCIRDRFREADKHRARHFLVTRLQQMGLSVTIERTKLPKKSYETTGGGGYFERFKAVNWEVISDTDLNDLFFNFGMVSDVRKYVVEFLGWPRDPQSFKRLTAEMLDELAEKTDRLGKNADPVLIAAIEKKGLSVVLTHGDSKRFAEMLRNGAKLKPPPPVVESKRRRATPPEDALVAEDAPRVVNIVAEIRGTKRPDEVIEIIAHYDTKVENAGGADDNGTGLVTSLELMRLMAARPPTRTVRVIFSDREEIDSLGAEYHVSKLKERPNEKIVGVLVPDMFGYSHLGRPRFVLELGSEKDFTTKEAYEFSKRFVLQMAKQWDLYKDRVAEMEIMTFSAESDMGDHGPYWDANLPAIFIASPLKVENPANHSPRDKIENMNLGIFTEVAHFLGEVLVREAGASINLTDMAHANNLSFLKAVLKPENERTDASADLYFEVKRPQYTGTYVSPSSSGFSGSTTYGPSNREPLFSNGNYVGRRHSSSSSDYRTVPRTPPIPGPAPGATGSGPRYKTGPSGFPVGNSGPSAGSSLGGAEIKKMSDLDKGKKPPAILTPPAKPAETKAATTKLPANKPAQEEADGGSGYIDSAASKLAKLFLFRIRPTSSNGK